MGNPNYAYTPVPVDEDNSCNDTPPVVVDIEDKEPLLAATKEKIDMPLPTAEDAGHPKHHGCTFRDRLMAHCAKRHAKFSEKCQKKRSKKRKFFRFLMSLVLLHFLFKLFFHGHRRHGNNFGEDPEEASFFGMPANGMVMDPEMANERAQDMLSSFDNGGQCAPENLVPWKGPSQVELTEGKHLTVEIGKGQIVSTVTVTTSEDILVPIVNIKANVTDTKRHHDGDDDDNDDNDDDDNDDDDNEDDDDDEDEDKEKKVGFWAKLKKHHRKHHHKHHGDHGKHHKHGLHLEVEEEEDTTTIKLWANKYAAHPHGRKHHRHHHDHDHEGHRRPGHGDDDEEDVEGTMEIMPVSEEEQGDRRHGREGHHRHHHFGRRHARRHLHRRGDDDNDHPPHHPDHRRQPRLCAVVDLEIVLPASYKTFGKLTVRGALLTLSTDDSVSAVGFETLAVGSVVGHINLAPVKANNLTAHIVTGVINVEDVQVQDRESPLYLLATTAFGNLNIGATIQELEGVFDEAVVGHQIVAKAAAGQVQLDVRKEENTEEDFVKVAKTGDEEEEPQDLLPYFLYVTSTSTTGNIDNTIAVQQDQALVLVTKSVSGGVHSTISDQYLGSFELKTVLGQVELTEAEESDSVIEYDSNTPHHKAGSKYAVDDEGNKKGGAWGSIDAATTLGRIDISFL